MSSRATSGAFRERDHRSGAAPLAAALVLALSSGLVSCDRLPGKPVPPVDETNSFAAMYAANCAGCHGANGTLGPARPLNDALYLAVIPDEAFLAVVANGVPGTAMPGFGHGAGGPLDDAQLAALINGIRATWGRATDLPSADELPAYAGMVGTDPSTLEAGRVVYDAACARCHGPVDSASDVAVRRIADIEIDKGRAGDSVETPRAGSILDRSFLALVSDQALRSNIIAGRPDLGQPDFRTVHAGGPLTDAQITALVSWIASHRATAFERVAPGVTAAGEGQ